MPFLHTEIVSTAHSYTREDVPWEIDDSKGKRAGKRLAHYISGGGMRTFGRTVAQQRAALRRRRFTVFAAAVGVLWTVFYCL